MSRVGSWSVLPIACLAACGDKVARVVDVPSAPFVIESIGAPERQSDNVNLSVRLRSRSNTGIDNLSVSVRVLDEHGARVDELRAHRVPLGWQRLQPGEERTWQLAAGLDAGQPTIDLSHIQVVPRSAALCDGSTWEADEASLPANPMLRGCPSEVGLGPSLEVRDGRVHGRGYSFAVPDGYEVDERWAGRTLRRHGIDEWISVSPGMSGWIDLDPTAFDLAQCRNLLAYNMYTGNMRFDVQRAGADITTCAQYIDNRSAEIIVAARGDDFRIHCWFPGTFRGCVDVAASWRLE